MPNIVPGVIWQPVNVGSRAARRKGRGLVGHVAVSSSKNLVPNPAVTGKDWHFYLPKEGPAYQYIDLDVQCWSSGAGNASLVAYESEGGLGTTAQVNAEPWNDNQLNWAARILRHLHDTEGVPLWVMENSLPTERGFGTHRLGIDPYRVAGGELWSSSYGKACPGDAKHAQRAEVVRRATTLDFNSEGFLMALTDKQQVDLANDAANARYAILNLVKPSTDQIPGLVAAIGKLSEVIASDRDDLTADELKQAVVDALEENVVKVSIDVAGALAAPSI